MPQPPTPPQTPKPSHAQEIKEAQEKSPFKDGIRASMKTAQSKVTPHQPTSEVEVEVDSVLTIRGGSGVRIVQIA